MIYTFGLNELFFFHCFLLIFLLSLVDGSGSLMYRSVWPLNGGVVFYVLNSLVQVCWLHGQ